MTFLHTILHTLFFLSFPNSETPMIYFLLTFPPIAICPLTFSYPMSKLVPSNPPVRLMMTLLGATLWLPRNESIGLQAHTRSCGASKTFRYSRSCLALWSLKADNSSRASLFASENGTILVRLPALCRKRVHSTAWYRFHQNHRPHDPSGIIPFSSPHRCEPQLGHPTLQYKDSIPPWHPAQE